MGILTVNFENEAAPTLFCRSLQETGFAVLTNHPIAPQMIHDMYSDWEAFFDSADKFNYLYKAPCQHGYFPFKTENAKHSKISDLKEFYHVYANGLIPPHLKSQSLELHKQLSALAATLLKWVEIHLPSTHASQLERPLHQMIEDCENTVLRIIHYPPLTEDREKDAVRAAPHEDINLITLLPAATQPGLEVLDKEGNWHAVSCDPGNIVVNVGDMLQTCTQEYYRSTTHRVKNPESENISRFSMPFFLHAHPEVRLSPKYTAGEYLTERLRQIGIQS